jgi:hypothetical protein
MVHFDPVFSGNYSVHFMWELWSCTNIVQSPHMMLLSPQSTTVAITTADVATIIADVAIIIADVAITQMMLQSS